MYSYRRTGSDSVGRVEREPAVYKPSYKALRETTAAPATTPSRSSRASSYDPFAAGATRTPMASPFRNAPDRTTSSSYSRPSYSGMSTSYTDYSAPTRSYSNRYGSTEQLNYKSPYNSVSTSGYTSGTLPRSNANFPRAGSV
ncbi:hypothetical protein OSTOST_21498, partial [Ostertagia ostertagi]